MPRKIFSQSSLAHALGHQQLPYTTGREAGWQWKQKGKSSADTFFFFLTLKIVFISRYYYFFFNHAFSVLENTSSGSLPHFLL